MSQLTAESALALSRELSAEVAARRAARAADQYDPSTYVWQSNDRIGNTLPEIHEIRAYGHPLPKRSDEEGATMGYRGFQYEGEDGFLASTQKMHKWNIPTPEDKVALDVWEVTAMLPADLAEKALLEAGKSEVVHNNHGRGFILEAKGDLVRVFFMRLPTETPTVQVGANIKWVKRDNLL